MATKSQIAEAVATLTKVTPGRKAIPSTDQHNVPLTETPNPLAVDQTVSIVLGGGRATGEVLAENFFAEVRNQATRMERFISDVQGLNHEGHLAFRAKLAEYRKAANTYVFGKAATKTKPAIPAGMTEKQAEKVQAKSTISSAYVRITEMIGLSKAIEAGFPVPAKGGYHAIVRQAVAYRQSQAAAGVTTGAVTTRRGRKAATKIEKAEKYLANLGLTARERHTLTAFLEAGAKLEAKTE